MTTLLAILTVIAIVVGPILAIQVQKLIERVAQRRQTKDLLFKTLMSTRDNRLLPDHVRALNMIDIIFSGRSKKDKAVIATWNEYRDHLYNYPPKPFPDSGEVLSEAQEATYRAKCEDWQSKSTDFLANLLAKMAENLNYHFDKVLLKRGAYTPTGYGETEFEQLLIRRGLAKVFLGSKSIPIHIVESPRVQETKPSQEITQQEKPNDKA